MSQKTGWNVAVIGATGVVGREMISILAERKFPIKNLTLFSSEKSKGQGIQFNDKTHKTIVLNEESLDLFDEIDIALLSAGGDISKKFIPLITQRGTVCIDNSSAWRMDPEVPLVVPEINYADLSNFKEKNIVANPNCSTIQMVQVLKPLHDAFKIKRVVVSTYQSTSGAGTKGMEELSKQTVALLNQKEVKSVTFPHQIAFNCIPAIDVFFENGSTYEEVKMVLETQKILSDASVKVSATCVRVPTFCSHGESVNIETHNEIPVERVRALLAQTPGVKVVDDPSKNLYPTHIYGVRKNDTFVGRIRQDESVENGVNLWIVSDNLRKGAALNAVQIAEALAKEFL